MHADPCSSDSPGGWSSLARLLPLILVFLTGCGQTPVRTEIPVGPVAPPISRPAPPKAAPSGIQPEERLSIYVMEDDSFSGSYTVGSTGDIIVPKLGRVKVGGMSVSAAEKALALELEKNTLTKATVLIDRPTPVRKTEPAPEPVGTEVFLSGKVQRPGRYTITSIAGAAPSVHQAILQAGGCSRFAHKRKTHVLRRLADGRLQRIPADLNAIESGLARPVPLAQGDIIVVPEKKVDLGL